MVLRFWRSVWQALRPEWKRQQKKMRSFAEGQVDTIPELMEESLQFKRRADGTIETTNIMEQISTACTIDW